MDPSHYRIPADLVRILAARLALAPDRPHQTTSSALEHLSNSQLAVIFQEMLESETSESASLKRHLCTLSEEEEAQRNLLLRQIRQTTKLTLHKQEPKMAGAAAGG